MGKSKPKPGTSLRKFKALRDQFDGLGEEVRKIESGYLPILPLKRVAVTDFYHPKELMRPRNGRDTILMTQRMEVYPNLPEQLEKVMALVITCRARWALVVVRTNKYTCPSL
jgi:hypothetical protein